MKLCIDCMHHRRLMKGGVIQHICYAQGLIDPVIGQSLSENCYTMRRALFIGVVDVSDCGPEAKLFKPKEGDDDATDP
jgi:hypothetical protein